MRWMVQRIKSLLRREVADQAHRTTRPTTRVLTMTRQPLNSRVVW
jgi:hypothetical protein